MDGDGSIAEDRGQGQDTIPINRDIVFIDGRRLRSEIKTTEADDFHRTV